MLNMCVYWYFQHFASPLKVHHHPCVVVEQSTPLPAIKQTSIQMRFSIRKKKHHSLETHDHLKLKSAQYEACVLAF